MSINFNRDTDVEPTDKELEQIREEYNTIRVRSHNGNEKSHHLGQCSYLRMNDVDTMKRDIANYPGAWLNPCKICLVEWRNESLD